VLPDTETGDGLPRAENIVLTAPTDVKASGTGTAGSPLIVTGNVTILNTDLAAGLAYKSTTGYSGADVLGLMILDSTDGAQGPVDAISITVNPLPAVNFPRRSPCR
jgi:hypothetical protein